MTFIVRVMCNREVVSEIEAASRYDAKQRRLRLSERYPDHQIVIVRSLAAKTVDNSDG